jgi:hypothetical protein
MFEVNRSIARAWWACGLLGASCVAQAEEATVSGSVRMDYFSSSRHLDDVNDVMGASLQLKAGYALTESQYLEFDGVFSRADILRDGDDESRLNAAYWRLSQGALDLRIGQQKVRWGKADGINPTDFFTPSDYTVLLPLEEDRYRAIPAVRADVAIGDASSVSFVLSPNFTRSELPWEDLPGVEVSENEPSGSHQPQYGVRWSHTGSRFDWSLSAFNGFETLPVLDFVEMEAGALRYERNYPDVHGFGADLAFTVGQWGLRAELAYKSFEETDVQSIASNWSLAAGGDRSFDNWNINVQALARYTPDYRTTLQFSNEPQQLSATLNAIVHGQQDRMVYGATTRIAAHWLHETLQTELLAVAYFEPDTWYLRPLVTYAVSDRLKVRFGGEYYEGAKASYFGLLEKNRTVFLELQQYF